MQAVDVLTSCRELVVLRRKLFCLHRPLFCRGSASRLHNVATQKQQSQRIQRPHAATAALNSSNAWEQDALGRALLTRDFIAKSLYNQDTGYFSTKDVINDLPGPLEFGSMLGELHYRMDVKKAYESKLSAWMTPVETFSPYFSHALARYISREVTKTATAAAAADGTSSTNADDASRKSYVHRGADVSSAHAGGAPRKSRSHRGTTAGPDGGRGGPEKLVLYEAGGGTGTNALNVLNWLRREEPKLYERTEYTIVEISERLAERQAERVCAVHENCRVVNANVLEWGMSGDVDPRPCFFLGMELLDNLPHDKIAWATPSMLRGDGNVHPQSPENAGTEQLCEAIVVETPDGFREAFRPLRDPVIRELLTFCPDIVTMVKNRGGSSSVDAGAAEDFSSNFLGMSLAGLFGGGALRPEHRAAFVPTGSFRLVQALRKRLPRHRAILADFDSFEESTEGFDSRMAVEGGGGGERGNDESLMAFQAPIVSSRDPTTGSVTDHATYMAPLGSADIFFPTCFERLSRLHAAVCRGGGVCREGGGGEVRRGKGLVVKQGEFLEEFADLRATRTFSGFNPLVDDFRNSSVFLSGAVLP